jgi:formate--tetrahydrofolate ligase
MKPIVDVARSLGIEPTDIEPYGHYKAKLSLNAFKDRPRRGKLVLVSAITPTPAGEGKTTTTIGLVQGLARIGVRSAAALREPSLGPVFGMKGGGAGGGASEVVPMMDINMHFNGDFHAVTSAHNLLAALVDNCLHNGNTSGLDPRRVTWKRVIDMNDRALRDIVVGLGGRTEGIPRETGFDITAASEVMAILCLADGIPDLKLRLGRIVVGYSADGTPVTARDVNAVGAMAALLKEAIKPNLVQTTEGVPAFVHGGPFANIAHGTNSIAATRAALAYADIVVTEAGFAFELGAEKFFDINCRYGGFAPACTVLVATIRALKMHGGKPLAEVGMPDVAAMLRGLSNMEKHVENIRKFGQPCVVAINRFAADTPDEVEALEQHCRRAGGRGTAVRWWRGGLHGTGRGGSRPRRKERAAIHTALRLERFDRAQDRHRRPRDVWRACGRLHGAGQARPRAPRKGGLRQVARVHRQDAAVLVGQPRPARPAQGLPRDRARDPSCRRRRIRHPDHRRDHADARAAKVADGKPVRPYRRGRNRLRR